MKQSCVIKTTWKFKDSAYLNNIQLKFMKKNMQKLKFYHYGTKNF